MDFVFETEHESIRFQAEMDGHVCFSENSLYVELNPEIGRITVNIEPGPIPDLKNYYPSYINNRYYKSEENKEYSLYEEIFVIGQHEQKTILTIKIMDYATKTTRARTTPAKSVKDFLNDPFILKFLSSVNVIDDSEPPRTPGFILR